MKKEEFEARLRRRMESGKPLEYEQEKNMRSGAIAWSISGTLALFGVILLGMWGCPKYSVWQKGLEGQAELAHATYSRQIAVTEALAKMEAASNLAQAEITRAEGLAKANKILGDSLRGNHEYLRYLWIDMVAKAPQREVIYVPTEANIPILEARDRK